MLIYIYFSYYLQGADITRRTKKGETLKNLALLHKHTSIVALIDKHMSPQEPTRKEASMSSYESSLYFFEMKSICSFNNFTTSVAVNYVTWFSLSINDNLSGLSV